MTPKFQPVPFAASNVTTRELVALVEHNYPNLQGPLRALVERAANVRGRTAVPHSTPIPAHCCPHCGSAYRLDQP